MNNNIQLNKAQIEALLKYLDTIKANSEQFTTYELYKNYNTNSLNEDGFTRIRNLKLQQKMRLS
jgi:hypothetical protein